MLYHGSHSLVVNDASSVLVFISATGKGFQVDYPSITLHAISRAEAGPSIYCQLDDAPAAEAAVQVEEDDVANMRELVIVPKDSSARTSLRSTPSLPRTRLTDRLFVLRAVEPIFESLSICASLHPDPNDADAMDDDDDAFVDAGEFETFDGDADQELSEVGKVRSDFLNGNRYNPY